MISNQTIQNCIEEAAKISGLDIFVADSLGLEITSTAGFGKVDKTVVLNFMHSDAETQEIGDYLFVKVENEDQLTYVLIIKGVSTEKKIVGKLVASELSQLTTAYKDKVDKNSFFQNLLLDNLLLVDIYNRAQKLHIDAVKPRCVFVIELSTVKDPGALEMVKELFYSQRGDFVTTVDEDHIIVIKSLDQNESYDVLDENAKMLVDMFGSEALTNVRVSYGTIVNDIKGVSKSYKEALMALDVGRIFYADKPIIAYNTLGIGRLIYQLPVNLCEMYIDEVFGGEFPAEIDDEILGTINKFLDNSLNVSETSRQLYIHRNTLVYRIEKLEKATGLDVRQFEDALTFRIAMMVLKYVEYIKKQNI